MIHHEIKDIVITGDFWADYLKAPEPIRNKLDRLVTMIGRTGTMPPSLKAHKAVGDGIWIGYLNQAGQHWRLLFYLNDGVMELDRVLSHEKRDKYLKVRR